MNKVLIVCSSTDGQTLRICERLRDIVAAGGAEVTLVPVEQADRHPLDGFQLLVLGARIRYGRTHARVFDYVDRHAEALNTMPSAYFSVNLVARKATADRPETNPYVRQFLRRARWRPRLADVFAGRLDYPRYGWLDRQIIRFIMWLTGGPTQRDAVVEFTDWQRVDQFGSRLRAALAGLTEDRVQASARIAVAT